MIYLDKQDIPWVEKYRPYSTKNMIGFQNIIQKLRDFIENFFKINEELKKISKQQQSNVDLNQSQVLDLRKKTLIQKKIITTARILLGPPGVGKTTVVYALAHDLNLSIIEMNASDVRTEDAINHNLNEAVKSRNLLGFVQNKPTGKLILIDEVDGIHGQSDRGGVNALEKIIQISNFPIIMTCNFRDDTKLGNLYKIASPIIEVPPSKTEDIIRLLQIIAEKEKITVSIDQLQMIVEKSSGDFRSAINDLQVIAQGLKNVDDEDILHLNIKRDNLTEIQDFMNEFFNTKNIRDAKKILDNVQQDEIDFQTIHRWINENILKYLQNPIELSLGFEILAIADRILGYIKMTQDYSHLSYFFDILAGGIRFSKLNTLNIKAKIDNPRFFRTRAVPDNEYALKLQKLYRMSLNDILRDLRPILLNFIKINPNCKDFLARKFNIESKNIESVL